MEISTDERFRESLRYLARKFQKRVRKVGERYQIHLSSDINLEQYFDALVYQIVTTMKRQYIYQKIKIKHPILIRILGNYDKKTDIIIATTILKITPVILLDAIYDFGISQLKQRWDEVVKLVNDNQAQLTQPQLFNELLRFLIVNMDCKIPEAHVLYLDKKPQICNSQLEPFKPTDKSIINSLIDLAPKQIFLHIDQHLDTKLVHEIEKLFPNCVCIEYSSML